jgi:hypothetical protein
MNFRAFLLCLLFIVSFAQSSKAATILLFEHKTYTWHTYRNLSLLTDSENRETALILKDKHIIEYVYDNNNELKVVETIHKIIRVNTTEAVSMFNKIFIPMDNVLNIIVLKARFISKSGIITELNNNNIKDIENSNQGNYKIFAIEGAEVGGEIEYYYSIEKKAMLFGREIFQNNLICKNVEFEIITPKNVIFEAKSYNNFPQASHEQKYENKNVLLVHLEQMPAKITENNFITANLKRIDYKLSHYTENPQRKIFTWNNAAKFIAESVYNSQKLSATDLQNIKNIVANLTKNSNNNNEEAKIIAIENYIKENIRIEENCSVNTITDILDKKYSNKLGIIRLFALFFDLAKVPHQIILTSDRNKAKFDASFENWNFLEHYLFYFPENHGYLAPNHLAYRYSLVPPYLTAQDGLFIDYSFQLASAIIQEIPAAPAQATTDESEFVLFFDKETYQMKGTCRKHFSGYYATSLNYAYEITENKQILSERIFRTSIADVALADTKIMISPIKPTNHATFLDIETSLLSTSLVEKSGDKLLFKVGELLAQDLKKPQNTLADSTNLVITQDFNKIFKRKITLTIPDGYVVRNLENLKYEMANDKNFAWFSVTYELKDNKVEILIEGGNSQIYYEKEQQENLRKVVEAMKKFEQTVLLFQKIR